MAVPMRRPAAVLFDVLETLVQLEPLRQRFVEAGRPGHELELFFARMLRDGMAFTLAGEAPPFRAVAAAELALTTGLGPEPVDHILDGFTGLPLQPDAEPAFDLLADAGIPCYAFTHGSASVISSALDAAGIGHKLAGILSAESIASFKPPSKVYHWACREIGVAPEAAALVAVHSWDTHGALRAGLLAGLATRLEGALSPVVDRPHVVAARVDDVVEGFLA
ncbi:HAD family hydrolase [Amycolatopsis sp. CA-230715]|uniref:HAD family hydrolase n=1 Tax=Amycolatopsis sp. CA-230715 TaxID=2745196 RepID=UPI001C00D79D|nr:HAD family hydrolase [Amycolatopsis sp. CA-230715]